MRILAAIAFVVLMIPRTTDAQFYDPKKARAAQSDSSRRALREALEAGEKEGKERQAARLDTMAAQADRQAYRSGDREVAAQLRWRGDSLRMEAAAIRNPRLPRPGPRPVSAPVRTREADRRDDRVYDGGVAYPPPPVVGSAEPPATEWVPIPRQSSAGGSTTRDSRARVMIYSTTSIAGAINVSVDGAPVGGLIEALPAGQPCGARGAITITVTPGTHTLSAQGTSPSTPMSWGPVQRSIVSGDCYVWRLDAGSRQVVTAPQPTPVTEVRVVFWTRRSPNIEGFSVSVDGRLISPAPWSFREDPSDCDRMSWYAIRTYRPGDQFVVETHASMPKNMTYPLLSSHRAVVPAQPCFFWEIR